MTLESLARRQYDVITTAQARQAGLTPRAIAWRVESGRWRDLGRGLYHVNNAEVTWWTRASAGVLRAGQGAALVGESALVVHGLTDRYPPVITLGVPLGRHPARLPGTRVTRRRRLDVVTRERLPVTTIAQTVIDLADEPGTKWREAVALNSEAVRRRRVTADALAAELQARARHQHRDLLNVALGAVASGAETPAEVAYLQRVQRRHGLPEARLQAPAGRPGFRIRRDVEYAEWGLVVEIDGSVHREPSRWLSDMARDRQATTSGIATLRFASLQVMAEPCEVTVDVVLALRSRGFTGIVQACGPSCPLGRIGGRLAA